MTQPNRRLVMTCLAALFLALPVRAQTPVGTAFSYQGRLEDAGAPANGTYDLRFVLYSGAVGGSQVGPIVTRDDASVSNGLFTLSLDFGAVFGGDARFLEVGVRPGASGGAYATLSPRQELTPAPNALQAPWSGVSAKPAGFADGVDNDSGGTITSVTAGTGLTGGTITTSGTIAVNFGGTGGAATASRSDHGHSAGDVTSGTLNDARLSANVALLATPQTFTAAKTFSAAPSLTAAGAPLVVSSATRVANLNADLLDGLNSTQFASTNPPLTLSGAEALHIIKGTNSSTTVFSAAVFGDSTAASGVVFGVRGQADSPDGIGVYGLHDAISGAAPGVFGETDSTTIEATGVYGLADASTGVTYGVRGQSDSSIGRGVFGLATATTGSTMGVRGQSDSSGGTGVLGLAPSGGRGVWGLATATTGITFGVRGESDSTSGTGVLGLTTATTGVTDGVRGQSDSTNGAGLVGVASATAGPVFGVYATASSTSGYAGFFVGRVSVSGTLSKGGGAFKIDHPLDPERQYLYHSFVESPDMMNIYNGNITTDGEGYATVELPDWFEALNRDFRYQLTVVDDGDLVVFVQAKVVRKVAGNRFTLRTSLPGTEVSWQVTGIRKDAFAEKHRIPVVEDKPEDEIGTYLHPEAFGLPKARGLDYKRGPQPEELEPHP